MEPVAVRSGRRGRKRKIDAQNATEDREVKKQVIGTRSQALVGRYVLKEFEGSGIFLGKIVRYDTGCYRVDYEDGDCEDFETAELKKFLIGDGDWDDDLMSRKKKLDGFLAMKDLKEKDLAEGNANALANVVEMVGASSICERVEASPLSALSNEGIDNEIDDDADSSSDSCEHTRDHDFSSEVVAPVVPPPQLPPSSGSIGVPEEYVSLLFSVYGFLRSFSIRLFLSPFQLDDFVGSLNCPVPNTLLDAIHVALMRALRRHLQMLSSDGSELASKCLRFTDWNLLDTLTWPVYLVQYLVVMGYTTGPEWKGFYVDVLEKDYYILSAARKLMILQILCDDVLESEELRAEIDMREESEVGIDSDAVAAVGSESGPRRVHPKYSKTSACRNEEAVEIMGETCCTKSSCNSSYLGVKNTLMNVDADIVNDGNGDECWLCGMDGTLLCCDGCPSAYHSRCIGVSKIPEGAWYCPECTINKIGPTITRGTSLRGAEMFGVDSYGQVFLGTCNHLLVLRVSMKSEPCLRYYHLNDIPKVLQALYSSVQHILVYSEICKGILQYWDIQNDILPKLETAEMFDLSANVKNDSECSTPSFTALGKERRKLLNPDKGENLSSCMTENRMGDSVVSSLENACKVPGFNKISLNTMTQTEHPSQQRSGDTSAEQVCLLKNIEFSEKSKVDCSIRSGSVIQQADSSDLTHRSSDGKPSFIESATCNLRNSTESFGGHVKILGVTVNSRPSQSREGNERVCGRGYRNSPDEYSFMGSHFKPQAYVNNYTHGDFAASAAAYLAILSSEENQISGSHASDKQRKVVSADNVLQVKAFSSAAVRFFWPNSEKKLVEVPRERCGWCLSCRSAVTCKKGCLLNAAVSNAIKGAMKILGGLRPVKNGEGSLPGIATYVMLMEESLRGLTVGPFRSAVYRKQWRQQVEQATTCSAIKALLLELEENIRAVAVLGDWLKLVNDWSVETSGTQSATFATVSTQKRGPSGRRGRKRSASQVTSDDCLDNLSDVNWWRGGMLSKFLLQKGILPHSLVKKAARQGGYRKIPGLYYAESSEIPKRSRQNLWRAAVEMSKNASQLALQVRYLDLHVRWSDLVRPEQNLLDGKGPETEASAFRNAFVCDKKNLGDKIIYGVAFGNQKHLPSRVTKNVIQVDQMPDGREKYWFSEMHIPLYLIKEYEEKLNKMHVPLADKPVNVVCKLQRRQLKAFRKDIFSYLSCKRDNLGKCCCASCQLHVLYGNAVNCSLCQGFFHAQCTISSTNHRNGEVKFLITCKKCYHIRTLPQHENISESRPTSPKLLQGRESQSAVTGGKGAKRKGFNSPLTSAGLLESSLEMKSAMHDSSLVPKNQRKLCSWGLIWKKKKVEDGIDFRLKNIILRGNSDCQSGPVCHLCNKPYNSDLLYIRCETCKNWYHAEAVELDESEIGKLLGFKCCRCRRIRTPVCPYMDPETKKKLESKRPCTRAPKERNSRLEPDYGNPSEQPKQLESNPTMSPKTKEVMHVQKIDPLLFPLSKVEKFAEHNLEMGLERNTFTATGSGCGPQKLPVRRHIKNEDNVDGLSQEAELSTPIEQDNAMNSKEESFSPHVEWDVAEKGFDGHLLVDCEGLSYDDMEFEPQTYFSFTELLASDEVGQLDEIDASGYVMGGWEKSSEVSQDGYLEQCGMGSNNHQEPTITGEPGGHPVPCQRCLCKEPCPDISCEICGLWIHRKCSPWVEQPPLEGNWRCGNCREWR